MNETQIRQTIAELEVQIVRLLQAKDSLEALLGLQVTPKPEAKPKAGRAPRGSVESAVLALKPKAMTNAEVRGALKAQGYAYPLSTLPMGKVLNRLTKAKKLSKKERNGRVEFSLA